MNVLLDLAVNKYVKDGHRVLELGSGNGKFLKALMEKHKLDWVLGLDFHKGQDFPTEAEFRQMDLENFVCSEKFDAIIMNNILEHIKNPIGLLEKVKACLETDGALLIAVPNRYGWNNEAKVYFPNHGKHYFLYDEEHLKYILERLGFACRFHNVYGQSSHPLYIQVFQRLFNVQSPVLIVAAFHDQK